MSGFRSRIVAASLAAIFFVATSASAQNLKLPSNEVSFYADGAVDSFFSVTLSGVPAGLDVENDVYAGYCVSYYDATSPTGNYHVARLFSSTDPNLPRELSEAWSYINYILNHQEGGGDDVQSAIWYFTDQVNWDISEEAQAMIDAALANGAGYRPGPGGVVAVIVDATDDSEIQRIIIEVPVPVEIAECDDFVTGGGWILTAQGAKANFGVHGGIRNGAFWGGLNYIDHGTKMHVKSTGVTGYTHLDEKTRQIGFNVTIDGVAGTAVVTVTDNGEPGTRDRFNIQLSSGYSAGGELGGTAKRGGGGNIQLHKAHCKDKDKGKPGK
jgi:hypothetical protein